MASPAKLSGVDVEIAFPYLFKLTGKWSLDESQRLAAWELYVELVTRIATVELPPDDGLLREALSSLHALFPTTRDILRRHGPAIARPTKKGTLSVGYIAVMVLNRGIRPFLAKWHPALLGWEQLRPAEVGAAAHERSWMREAELRRELSALQATLRQYGMVLETALGVEHSLIGTGAPEAST